MNNFNCWLLILLIFIISICLYNKITSSIEPAGATYAGCKTGDGDREGWTYEVNGGLSSCGWSYGECDPGEGVKTTGGCWTGGMFSTPFSICCKGVNSGGAATTNCPKGKWWYSGWGDGGNCVWCQPGRGAAGGQPGSKGAAGHYCPGGRYASAVPWTTFNTRKDKKPAFIKKAPTWTEDRIFESCGSNLDQLKKKGKYISKICNQGTLVNSVNADVPGSRQEEKACGNPSGKQYVTFPCQHAGTRIGTNGPLNKGSPTYIGDCSSPGNGEWVQAVCVPGNYSVSGTNTDIQKCSSGLAGQVEITPCNQGTWDASGHDAKFSSHCVSQTCSGADAENISYWWKKDGNAVDGICKFTQGAIACSTNTTTRKCAGTDDEICKWKTEIDLGNKNTFKDRILVIVKWLLLNKYYLKGAKANTPYNLSVASLEAKVSNWGVANGTNILDLFSNYNSVLDDLHHDVDGSPTSDVANTITGIKMTTDWFEYAHTKSESPLPSSDNVTKNDVSKYFVYSLLNKLGVGGNISTWITNGSKDTIVNKYKRNAQYEIMVAFSNISFNDIDTIITNNYGSKGVYASGGSLSLTSSGTSIVDLITGNDDLSLEEGNLTKNIIDIANYINTNGKDPGSLGNQIYDAACKRIFIIQLYIIIKKYMAGSPTYSGTETLTGRTFNLTNRGWIIIGENKTTKEWLDKLNVSSEHPGLKNWINYNNFPKFSQILYRYWYNCKLYETLKNAVCIEKGGCFGSYDNTKNYDCNRCNSGARGDKEISYINFYDHLTDTDNNLGDFWINCRDCEGRLVGTNSIDASMVFLNDEGNVLTLPYGIESPKKWDSPLQDVLWGDDEGSYGEKTLKNKLEQWANNWAQKFVDKWKGDDNNVKNHLLNIDCTGTDGKIGAIIDECGDKDTTYFNNTCKVAFNNLWKKSMLEGSRMKYSNGTVLPLKWKGICLQKKVYNNITDPPQNNLDKWWDDDCEQCGGNRGYICGGDILKDLDLEDSEDCDKEGFSGISTQYYKNWIKKCKDICHNDKKLCGIHKTGYNKEEVTECSGGMLENTGKNCDEMCKTLFTKYNEDMRWAHWRTKQDDNVGSDPNGYILFDLTSMAQTDFNSSEQNLNGICIPTCVNDGKIRCTRANSPNLGKACRVGVSSDNQTGGCMRDELCKKGEMNDCSNAKCKIGSLKQDLDKFPKCSPVMIDDGNGNYKRHYFAMLEGGPYNNWTKCVKKEFRKDGKLLTGDDIIYEREKTCHSYPSHEITNYKCTRNSDCYGLNTTDVCNASNEGKCKNDSTINCTSNSDCPGAGGVSEGSCVFDGGTCSAHYIDVASHDYRPRNSSCDTDYSCQRAYSGPCGDLRDVKQCIHHENPEICNKLFFDATRQGSVVIKGECEDGDGCDGDDVCVSGYGEKKVCVEPKNVPAAVVVPDPPKTTVDTKSIYSQIKWTTRSKGKRTYLEDISNAPYLSVCSLDRTVGCNVDKDCIDKQLGICGEEEPKLFDESKFNWF